MMELREKEMNGCENKKHGTVKRFLDAGYGFLVCEGVEWDIFFHVHNWRSAETPTVGQRVTFEFGPARAEGQRKQAVNIHPVKDEADIFPEIGPCSQDGV
jgi:cold shock CspA family protein